MTKWKLCPDCKGEGTVVHPACSVWTPEDRAEDPESFADMLSGVYDVGCARCGGRRVVPVNEVGFQERLDEERLRGAESGDPELFNNPRLGLY